MKRKKLISEEGLIRLQNCSPGTANLFRRCYKKDKKRLLKNEKYSEEIRQFALTLHFYSPAAYNFVRKSFDTCLPHTRTIRKWMSSVKTSSNFNENALETIRHLCDASKEPIYVNIVQDEMAIRQHLEWDRQLKKWSGFVDIVPDTSTDHRKLAKEAINYMAYRISNFYSIFIPFPPLNSLKRAF